MQNIDSKATTFYCMITSCTSKSSFESVGQERFHADPSFYEEKVAVAIEVVVEGYVDAAIKERFPPSSWT